MDTRARRTEGNDRAAPGGARSSPTVISYGELTVTVAPAAIPEFVAYLQDRPELPLHHADRHHRGGLAGAGEALRRRLSLPVDAPEPADPGQGRGARGRAGALDRRRVPLGRLVRARGLRHVRDPVLGAPGPAAHPDRLRLPRLSAAQGLPDHRLCRAALRRGAEAGGLRAGEADAGVPAVRLHDRPGRARSTSCPATRRRRAGGTGAADDGSRAAGRGDGRQRPTSGRRAEDPQLQHQLRAAASGGAWGPAAGARARRRDRRALRPAYRAAAPRHREADGEPDLPAEPALSRPARLCGADEPGACLVPGDREADRHAGAAARVADPGALFRDRADPEPPAQRHHAGDGRRRADPAALGVRGAREADDLLRAGLRGAAACGLLPAGRRAPGPAGGPASPTSRPGRGRSRRCSTTSRG